MRASARGMEVRWKAASQSQKSTVSPPTGRPRPSAQSATWAWSTGVPFSTGSWRRSSVSRFHSCQPGWWIPASTASPRIAFTRSTVRVRKR